MNGHIEHTDVERYQADDTTQHASQRISPSAEPSPAIAIIGMGMRLPGGVRSADDFWKLLIDGRDGFGPMPNSRYNNQASGNEHHEDDARSEGARSKTQGYFLQDDIAHFDVRFFNIADRHAAIMDPQQRLLQEVAWECLENGGQTDFHGKDIGCFVGVFSSDWLEMSTLDKQNLVGKQVVGSQDFCLANQVSQVLEITGPSVTIKTGCSSSMTALHSACQALYSDECSAAIVAGSSLNLIPTLTDSLTVCRAVSAGGICKTFDADANGYGRGEAVNAILIKKLDDAIRDGDAIRAVIRATATNSDGRQDIPGAPREDAQESVIRKAYAKAGIRDFSKTAFVECHGTGTQKGDITEAAAIAKVFEGGIMIGAVKPNVGHSEGAAGITSIIKAVIALENKIIPPNIHMKTQNPQIPFESEGLTVPLKPTPFPNGCAERISVCSMGAGGSNVHVILDSGSDFVPSKPAEHASRKRLPWRLLPISANSETSLRDQIRSVRENLNNTPEPLDDVAYTLSCRRNHLSHRSFLVSNGSPETTADESTVSHTTRFPSIALVFSGQGTQWTGMGKALMKHFDQFLTDIKNMNAALQRLPDPPSWSIETVLSNAREGDFEDAEISQPICTAVQLGLVNLIASWGVKACSSIGHSSGEIAAAYAAGAISMDVAITLSYYRGQTIKSHSPPGAMAAVSLTKELIAPLLTHGVTVACENSPRNVTIAGEAEHIDYVLKQISSRYPVALCKKLNVKKAYHSASMRTAAAEYAKLISDHVQPKQHTMKPMYSSSLGRMIDRVGDLDATYWRETMTAPVLFSTAVSESLNDIKANTLFLEIGPHAALLGPMREILSDYKGDFEVDCVPSLTREEDEVKSLLSLAGQLYARQVSLDLSAINGPGGTLVTNLPTYSWDHEKRYWYESRMSRTWRNCKYPAHELLGSRTLESTDSEPSWRNCINVEDVTWILDHNVAGEIVFPCAGFICMLGEAIRQQTGKTGYTIRELFIRSALVLQTQTVTEIVTGLKAVQLTDSADSSSWYDFTVSSFGGTNWRKHCVGQIRGGITDVEVPDVPEHPLTRRIDNDRWYKTMASHGLKYGDSFNKLRDISCSPLDYEAIGTAEVEESKAAEYVIHPTLVDQVFQLSGVAGCKGLSRNVHTLGVPISIEEIHIAANATSFTAKATFPQARDGSLDMTSGGTMTATSNGKLALQIKGAKFFPLKYQPSRAGTAPLGSRVEWRPYIDLLPSSDLVSPSEIQTKQIGLIIKMFIIAAEEWSDSMGMGVASLSSAMRVEFEELMGENKGRVREILQSILPLEDEWPLKPGASRPKYLKDVEDAIKGSDAALKPMRVFLETFLEMMEGKIPFMTYAFLDRGVPTVYDFTSTVFYLGRPLALMGHANPSLRVLEIGTKRCGTTAALLSCLHSKESVALFSKFVFASGSSKLLEEANEMFGGIDGFEARSLEVKEDFIKQGLEENSFDFIMAPYDLPKYADFSGILARIMKVLTPGGRLIVHEITPPVPVADYFMATPPVASLFGDRLKSQVPYPKELWTNALSAQGFEDIYSYASADYGNSWSAKVSISSIKPRPPQTPGGIDLVCLDRSHEWVQNVDRRLRQAGYKTQLHTMHTVTDAKTDVIVLIDVETPFLKDISKEDYDGLIKYMSQRRRTLWITRPVQMTCSDPSQGLILGLARTARFESGHDFATLEVDELNDGAAKAVVKVYHKLTIQPSVGRGAPDVEFALQDGVVHVPRYHWMPLTQSGRETTSSVKSKKDLQSKKDEKIALSVGSPPSFETLHWKHAESRSLGANEVEIDVHVVGLNFRDVMVSAGIISDGHGLGLEASGVIRRVGANVMGFRPGDRVSAMGSGLLCTRAIVPEQHCFAVPEEISLSDAATMPVALSTAAYSLQVVGQLKRNQTVLIHSASGAVGQAAIQVCQGVGAKMYATVGSELKAAYLVEAYGIPRENIFYSRDASFVSDLLHATKGAGCDIVLNSLSGELLHESWKCVASFGKMIELGKRDFAGHGSLKMQPFGQNRSFIGVDMLQIAEVPEQFARAKACLSSLGNQGKIRPIQPQRPFKASQVQQALAYMQRGTHFGKILIDMKSAGSRPNVDSDNVDVLLSSDASYLIVGGLGGIGKAICSWMVERGAKSLTILSRSAGASQEDQTFLQELRSQGCDVRTAAGDVTKKEDVQRAVNSSSKPVSGVLHLGMVLKSMSLLEQPHEDWRAVQSPKVDGAWNLHHALHSSKLDFFVVFSSISSLCGAIGQASYASANSFLDAFVQYRRSKNLPAVSINLGAVGDVGVFQQMPEIANVARATGVRFLDEKEVIQSLSVAIKTCHRPGSSQIIAGMSSSGDSVRQAWSEDARFRIYPRLQEAIRSRGSMDMPSDDKAFSDMVHKHPESLKTAAAEETLLRVIARRVIGPDADEVQRTRFRGMMIDSLVAVEMTGYLRRNFGLEISMAEIAGPNTMEAFSRVVLKKLYDRQVNA